MRFLGYHQRQLYLQLAMKTFIFSLLLAAHGAMAQTVVPDQNQLLEDVRILASTEFAGRATGSEGSQKARAYLRKRFEAIGIKAFPSGYEQAFTFRRKFWRDVKPAST